MTLERAEKLRRILRLAVRLPEDEREAYVAAVTEGDAELREAVDRFFRNDASVEQTLLERALPTHEAQPPL